jgi:hypothetical protein
MRSIPTPWQHHSVFQGWLWPELTSYPRRPQSSSNDHLMGKSLRPVTCATHCKNDETRIFALSMASARTRNRSFLRFRPLSTARSCMTIGPEINAMPLSIRGCPEFQGLNRFRAGSVLVGASTRWCQSLSCQRQCAFEILSWYA